MKLQAHAIALLPIELNSDEHAQLLNRYQWKHWTEGKDEAERVDARRFFNRSTVDWFRPLSHGKGASKKGKLKDTEIRGRWELVLGETPLAGLSLTHDSCTIRLGRVSMVRLGQTSMLYLSMVADVVSEEQLYGIQRAMFSFFSKAHQATLPVWRLDTSAAEQGKPLITWIETFIDKEIGGDKQYMEDWLGHELPYCLYVSGQSSSQQQTVTKGNNSGAEADSKLQSLAVNLAAGANPSVSHYRLAKQEAQELRQNSLAVWEQWVCVQAYHRLVFVSTDPAPALHANLFQMQYYADLFGLALYQRIRYERFQELLTSSDKSHFRILKEDIQHFRKQFNLTHVSSYPVAQRLYDYVAQRLKLRDLEQRIFTEIEYHHSNSQQEKQERYSVMLFVISVLAAIVLPLNSLSTLMALPPAQRGSFFWWIAFGASLGVLLLMWLPVLWRKWRRS